MTILCIWFIIGLLVFIIDFHIGTGKHDKKYRELVGLAFEISPIRGIIAITMLSALWPLVVLLWLAVAIHKLHHG